jgi:hypothetical protein
MARRIVLGLSRRFILYDWFHIMEQDSCRFVEEVHSVGLVSYNGAE